MGNEETIYDDACLDDTGRFSGEKFAHYLENEGSKVGYDNDVPPRGQLPSYYDEVKFKTAQETFRKYKANLCFVQLVGLVALLVDANAIKIIMMTKRSSEPSTARVRYKETFKHVLTWYTGDFSENSELWASIYRVRQMHNAANLQASKIPDIQQMSQMDLASTILGFIGFAVTNPNQFGLAALTSEELEALVHFWRVIGYLMGVQEKFNMCRGSLDDVKKAFRGYMDVRMKRHMKLKDANTLMMQFAAIQGISQFTAPLHPKIILNYSYELVFEDVEERSTLEFPLSMLERFHSFVFRQTLNNLQYEFFRSKVNSFLDDKMRDSTFT